MPEIGNADADWELVANNKLEEQKLLKIYSEASNIPVLDEQDVKDFTAFPDVTYDFLSSQACIPIVWTDAKAVVAIIAPYEAGNLEHLWKSIYGIKPEFTLARRAFVERFITALYDNPDELENNIFDSDSEQTLRDLAREAPIVRLVSDIFSRAQEMGASDIHVEPTETEVAVRFRIDGLLQTVLRPPKNQYAAIASRIKLLAGMNIAERRLPQDGRIELRINRKPIDLRVSTLPTRYGESVVLRVLDRSVVSLSLDNLGMTPAMTKEIRHMIKQPNGIFLVTGPTGSGKTTTLYSGLREINTMEDKLLTAEDPVEYDIEGILQLPIREGIGMTFPRALRAFLRQDPDRIMVGEIRDVETAGIAIQASLTGHLVLSTLHTNDAAGAVTRLIDMGIEPFLISSTVIGVLAQRLIRRCCNNCKTAYIPDDRELRMLGITREDIAGKPFYRGGGCELCNGSGYKGRVGIFELLHISEAIQGMINRRMPTQDIKRKAIEEGLLTLRQDGINQVLLGVSTAAEVLQYTMAN